MLSNNLERIIVKNTTTLSLRLSQYRNGCALLIQNKQQSVHAKHTTVKKLIGTRLESHYVSHLTSDSTNFDMVLFLFTRHETISWEFQKNMNILC